MFKLFNARRLFATGRAATLGVIWRVRRVLVRRIPQTRDIRLSSFAIENSRKTYVLQMIRRLLRPLAYGAAFATLAAGKWAGSAPVLFHSPFDASM